ncbi:MAG TPA: ATP-binding protein [Streptosporangiaceae bacterium]
MMTDEPSLIGAITIPGTMRAARVAREFVAEIVQPGVAALSDLVLCVSELVTNAVVHTKSGVRGYVKIQVTETEKEIRLDVTDEGGTSSVPHLASVGAGGRGLRILDSITTAWGVRPAGPGTTVWCTLPR